MSSQPAPKPVTRAGLVLAVLVLAVSGCDTGATSTPPRQTAAPSSSIPATGEARPTDPGSEATPAPLPELATAAGSRPGTQVTVHELRRSDQDSVRLVFTISNRGPGRWAYLTAFSEPGFVGGAVNDVGGIYLVDTANNLRHLVFRDSANGCVCTEEFPGALDEGEEFTAFAEFPAPPEPVASVTVVVPQFPPMDDVPVSP